MITMIKSLHHCQMTCKVLGIIDSVINALLPTSVFLGDETEPKTSISQQHYSSRKMTSAGHSYQGASSVTNTIGQDGICICMLSGSTHYCDIAPRVLSHHIVDFLGSRGMESAPTSIEVLLRPNLAQSDEPSDLRGSLSLTT